MAKLLRALGPRLLRNSKPIVVERLMLMETSRAVSTQSVGVGSGGRAGGQSVRSAPEDLPYAVKGLAHIAIVVPDLAHAAESYRTAFGAQVSEPLLSKEGWMARLFASRSGKIFVEAQRCEFGKLLGILDGSNSSLAFFEALPHQGVTVVFVHIANIHIELLHPLGDGSPVAKFLQKNPGGGLHHLCLSVDDINAASSYLNEDAGVRTFGAPSPGADGKPIVFLHPKDTSGVLIELQQGKSVSTTESEATQAGNH